MTDELKELVEDCIREIDIFKINAHKFDNKSAARRARKATLNLTKLFKEYRKKSIK